MNSAAVSVRDVVKAFVGGGGPVIALDHVSAELRHGEMTGILGPSGCGKTTLLMQIGLLDSPTSGSVLFDGEPVDRLAGGERSLRDYRRKNIGFVFQKPNLIPFLTALENVSLALIIDGWPNSDAAAKSMDLLAGLDLSDRSHSYPHQLSGGQQQRVAIARALAHDPGLILADEPTAALDSVRGRQVMEHLKHIATTRHAAVVVVTHDPRSLDLFDRILEMEDGRIVAERPA